MSSMTSVRSPWEEGSPDSRICVLGEAPSNVEMKLKRPLVGPAGDKFKEFLHAAGIARAQCYIINLWPYQCSKGRLGEIYDPLNRMLWHPNKGLTELGHTDALATIAKIRSCSANIVVSLGSPALEILAGSRKPITKWRGSPLFSERVGKKFIPTIHPAAVLYGNYIWRYFIIGDLGRAAEETNSPELVLPDRHIITAPSKYEVMEYIQVCRDAGRVCTDIEVMNNHVSCFSLSYRKDEALVVPLWDKNNEHYWSEDDEIDIWLEYAKLLGDRDVEKINHNLIGFDAVFLFDRCGIYVDGPIGDTMIAQSILNPDFRMGLDVTASMYTRQPYWKDDGKIWKPNHKITWEQFQRYCGTDAAVTLEIWEQQKKELDNGYWDTYNMTIDLKDVLAFMTIRGLKIDLEHLSQTKTKIDAKIQDRTAELNRLADYEFNPASSQQCAKYFYEHCGNEPYKNATGGITTDDKALSRLYRKGTKGSKEAKVVQEIRALNKLKNSYLEVELDLDHRLRCSWNPRGTIFGRLSSSKTIAGTGMNLQNLHPEFKTFIVAG